MSQSRFLAPSLVAAALTLSSLAFAQTEAPEEVPAEESGPEEIDPLTIDSDGDGVPDVIDAEPCNARVSARVYVPADRAWGMLMFEDTWPARGDFDFNDAVVAWNQTLRYDSSGLLTGVRMELSVLAAGAGASNGLAFRLPNTPRSSVVALTATTRNAAREPHVRLDANEAEAIVILADDVHALFGVEDTRPWVNTDPDAPRRPYVDLAVEITLDPGHALSAADAPFDLFIFDRARGTEVHRPRYRGTYAMDASHYNTADDGSTSTRAFVTREGIPFALEFPELTNYARERESVDLLYPGIVQFGLSGGTRAQDFYRHPSIGHAFGIASPRVLQAPPRPDTACFTPMAGVCGGATGTGSVNAPVEGLCEFGEPSAVARVSNLWRWRCEGIYSDPTSCTAPAWTCQPNLASECAVNNGSGMRMCNGSGTGWGTCTVTSCNAGYYQSGNACLAQVCAPGETRVCSEGNATGEQACDNLGSAWSGCGALVCNPGFVWDGQTCQSGASCDRVVFASDDFARVEGQLGGTLTTVGDQTWTVSAGTAQVAGGVLQLGAGSTAQTFATLDAATPNAQATVRYAGRSSSSGDIQAGLLFRFVDAQNHWRFYTVGSWVYLQRVEGGEVTQAYAGSHGAVVNATLGVSTSGTTIVLTVNGHRIADLTHETAHQHATRFGVFGQTTAAHNVLSMDDFTVVTGNDGAAPAVPRALRAWVSGLGATSATFTWDGVGDADMGTYQVIRNGAVYTAQQLHTGLGVHTATVSGIDTTIANTFSVLSTDACGNRSTATSVTIPAATGFLVRDDFNRSDSALHDERAPVGGHLWTTGAQVLVAGNVARLGGGTTAPVFATVNADVADGHATVTYAGRSSSSGDVRAGLVFRYVNEQNHWRYFTVGSWVYLERVVDGVATQVFAGSHGAVVNATLGVGTSGATIVLYVNGRRIADLTHETAHQTATRWGLYGQATSAHVAVMLENFGLVGPQNEVAPSVPRALRAWHAGPGSTSATFTWQGAGDADMGVYRVSRNGTVFHGGVAHEGWGTHAITVTGIDTRVATTFTVEAIDAQGNVSPAANVIIPAAQGGWLTHDDFNRSDAPLGGERSPVGAQPWSAGPAVTVVDGVARVGVGTTARTFATVDVGAADAFGTVVYAGRTSSSGDIDAGLTFRYVDELNHWRYYTVGSWVYLERVIEGAVTQVYSGSHGAVVNAVLGVGTSGSTIVLYVNGNRVADVTGETAHRAATRWGLYGHTTSAHVAVMLENFTVQGPQNAVAPSTPRALRAWHHGPGAQSATFTWVGAGDADMGTYQVRRNGVLFDGAVAHLGLGLHTITVTGVDTTSANTFSVTATDAQGNVSPQASVTIPAAQDGWLAQDDFNRSNAPLGGERAPVGSHTWSAGPAVQRVDGAVQLGVGTTASTFATFEGGTADGFATVTWAGRTSSSGDIEAGLVFRYIDDRNHWRYFTVGSWVYLERVEEGVVSRVYGGSHGAVVNATLGVGTSGTTIVLYVNGNRVADVTREAAHANATGWGLYGQTTSAHVAVILDNFTLVGPQNAVAPAVPRDLRAWHDGEGAQQATFTWLGAGDRDMGTYQVSRNGVLFDAAVAHTGSGLHTITVTGVDPSVANTFRITATDAQGNVSPAATVTLPGWTAGRLVHDDFARTDAPLDGERVPVGAQTWNATTASQLIGGAAHIGVGTTAATFATVDAGAADGFATVTYTGRTSSSGDIEAGIVFRYLNDQNHWRYFTNGSWVYLVRVSDGVATQVYAGSHGAVTNAVLGVGTSGSTIVLFVNGNRVADVTGETDHATATRWGLYGRTTASHVAVILDNFTVTGAQNAVAPSTPRAPRATVAGEGSTTATFWWHGAGDADMGTYQVSRNGVQVGTVAHTGYGLHSFTVPGVDTSIATTFTVTATDAQGNVSPSASVTVQPAAGIRASDDFNRSDADLGGELTPVGSLAWSANAGTRVAGGVAQVAVGTSAHTFATIDAGTSEGTASVRYVGRTSSSGDISAGIAFRYVSDADHFRFYTNGSWVYLQRVVNGTVTQLYSGSHGAVANALLGVTTSGTLIQVSVNGTAIFSVNDGAHLTATRWGLYGQTTSAFNVVLLDEFALR